MEENFKMVRFTCDFRMQIKISDNMTKEEILEKIIENWDVIHEFGANTLDESDDYSGYMFLDNIRDIVKED